MKCECVCRFSARMNITSVHRTVQTHEFKVNGEWDIYRTRAQWKVQCRDLLMIMASFAAQRYGDSVYLYTRPPDW